MSPLEQPANSSVKILLTEHDRVSQLYIYNRDMGEKRVSLYLSILSLGLTGMALVHGAQEIAIPYTLAFLAISVVTGTVTYIRLIERHLNAVCYLRAINRIHRYFAQWDESICSVFYWPPVDSVPSYRKLGLGLSENVLVLNSVIGAACVTYLLASVWTNWMLYAASFACTLALSVSLHVVYYRIVRHRAARSDICPAPDLASTSEAN